jgi:hypothetical protein
MSVFQQPKLGGALAAFGEMLADVVHLPACNRAVQI